LNPATVTTIAPIDSIQYHILALHGFSGCGEDFDALAAACGQKWHCPDLLGHKSQHCATDCSPSASLKYLTQQVTALPQPRLLLGYSMGARAALQLMLAQPNSWQGLILISGNPGIESEPQRTERIQADAKLANQLELTGLQHFLEFWQSRPLIRSQANIPAAIRAPMQANRRQHSTTGLANSLRQFGPASCPNLWPELTQISCPILCLTGENDPKYQQIAQRIAQLPSKPQHISIPQAGHMPHLEALTTSSHAIRQFIHQLTNAPAHAAANIS